MGSTLSMSVKTSTRSRRPFGGLAPRVFCAIAEKGDKGDPATSNVRAVQADGTTTREANETLVSFCPSGGAPDAAKCGTSPTVGLCLKKP
jgi:hypothetical protein